MAGSKSLLKARHFPLVLLLLAYLTSILLLRPFDDVFYGADDWGYAWSVKHLLETGEMRASSWVTAAAMPQTYWAAVFAKLFGVKPLVLNVATLVLSLIGVPLFYFAGLALRFTPRQSAWLGAVVLLTPFYIGFAGSFMSDTYFVVLMFGAIWALLSALGTQSVRMAGVGALFSTLGFLNRQVGLALPVAFGIALLLGVLLKRFELKRALRLLAAGAVLPLLSVIAYVAFPDAFGGRTDTQAVKMSKEALIERFLNVLMTLEHAYLMGIYVAVFLLPILIAFGWPVRHRVLEIVKSKRVRIPLIASAVLSIGSYIYWYVWNGSYIVRGEFLHTDVHGADRLPWTDESWTLLAGIASLALPIVVSVFYEHLRSSLELARKGEGAQAEVAKDKLLQATFLLLLLAAQCAMIAVFITYFNNYFLALTPVSGLLLASALNFGDWEDRRGEWLRLALTSLMALGSVVVLDSHFRYVEADKRVADELVASGLDSKQIFGYPSWFAWKHYDIVDREIKRTPWGIFERIHRRSQYWIHNENPSYRHRGWRVIDTHKYSTLHGEEQIEVSRRSRRR
jgi:hypothetical protein